MCRHCFLFLALEIQRSQAMPHPHMRRILGESSFEADPLRFVLVSFLALLSFCAFSFAIICWQRHRDLDVSEYIISGFLLIGLTSILAAVFCAFQMDFDFEFFLLFSYLLIGALSFKCHSRTVTGLIFTVCVLCLIAVLFDESNAAISCYTPSAALPILFALFRYWLFAALVMKEQTELGEVNSAPSTPASPTTEGQCENGTSNITTIEVAGDVKSTSTECEEDRHREESEEESWDAQSNANRISRLYIPPSAKRAGGSVNANVSVQMQQPAMMMNASIGMTRTMSGSLLSVPEIVTEQKRHSVSAVDAFDEEDNALPRITFADNSDVDEEKDEL